MQLAPSIEPTGLAPDLIVVGAGVAGMTAALVASLEGLRVVLCEASDQVGGTSSTSAGTLWVPGNPHGRRAGHEDSIDDAARYLEALIGPDDARDLRRTFLNTASEALDYLEERTSVKFASSGKHPDYLPVQGAAISGRAVSPLPFDGRLLGKDFTRIRAPIPEFLLLGGMMAGKADILALVGRWRSLGNFMHSARLVARYVRDRVRHSRGTRLLMGNALVARLFQSVRVAGVDVRFGWRLESLSVCEGKVKNVHFQTAEGARTLASACGVVLATGGVGHASSLRSELATGGERIFSLTCATVRGDGIIAARSAGAHMERHPQGNFFWQPVSVVPHHGSSAGLFPHLFLDRAKPGLVAVDRHGKRFVDEASSYHHFVEGMLRALGTPPGGKAWIICDASFVRRHGLGVIPPGTRNLRYWVDSGYVAAASTLESLARQVGIDPAGLAFTVLRSNAFALTGQDLDYAKGSTELDRFNGDATHTPNPCLGRIETAPFYALEIHAAAAASSAGLATDKDGIVLDEHDRPIAGLYACGNDAASIMRGTYPGPGTTLGPAIVFGYRIGRHASAASKVEFLNP